ncbi:hypothetical protein [Nitrosomonas halophila]|uniref:Uncharacterized protein n=1 Tax=Nitrosomonas halophila TaxID=44576 RepID=A0A1H3EN30_9PROT|nr:hypothetical protein [Nitrosomonas halophila]SDX79349.1 hypothetical protein SAMN05421881_100870 [Nitrosomonas halophila]
MSIAWPPTADRRVGGKGRANGARVRQGALKPAIEYAMLYASP